MISTKFYTHIASITIQYCLNINFKLYLAVQEKLRSVKKVKKLLTSNTSEVDTTVLLPIEHPKGIQSLPLKILL